MHKSITLIIGAMIFGVGIYVGALFMAEQAKGVYELDVVWDTALIIPLHTVVLTDLREGNIEKAIKTLEGSLVFKEALLNSCFTSKCLASN